MKCAYCETYIVVSLVDLYKNSESDFAERLSDSASEGAHFCCSTCAESWWYENDEDYYE
jgi:hypothetical protein